MTHDLFKTASKLELGMNEEGFFLYSENLSGNFYVQCGQAMTAALLMKTNGVRFFDYHPSLLNDMESSTLFFEAADAVGFAV